MYMLQNISRVRYVLGFFFKMFAKYKYEMYVFDSAPFTLVPPNKMKGSPKLSKGHVYSSHLCDLI